MERDNISGEGSKWPAYVLIEVKEEKDNI